MPKAQDVSTVTSFSDDVLAGVSTWQDAVELFRREGIAADTVADYGSGFVLTRDKNALVGVNFVVLEWQFHESKEHRYTDENTGEVKGRPFVALYLVTESGQKLILTDGGTGIHRQLTDITARRIAAKHKNPSQGLFVPGGLTVSEYDYTDSKGDISRASTYYLAEGAQAPAGR